MEESIIFSKSEKETKKIAEILGKEILKEKEIVILALKGDLGAGKTTFIKGLAKGLGIKKIVNSPTFMIFKEYKVGSGKKFYHFDWYRIKKKKELNQLGFEEILKAKNNIVAIEWPILRYLPQKRTILINFFHLPEKKHRKIIIKTYE